MGYSNPGLASVEAVEIEISFPIHGQFQPGKIPGGRTAERAPAQIETGMVAAADEGVVRVGLEERAAPMGADRGESVDPFFIGNDKGVVKYQMADRSRRIVFPIAHLKYPSSPGSPFDPGQNPQGQPSADKLEQTN